MEPSPSPLPSETPPPVPVSSPVNSDFPSLSDLPKTGDTSDLWLLTASLSGLLLFFLCRKKKNQN